MMRSTIRVLSVVLSASVAGAQPRSPIPSFDGSRLRAGVDTFLTVTANAGRQDTIGWATQSLARATVAGRDAWVQVYRWRGRDGSQSTDSLVLDARSLRPLSEARSTGVGSVAVTYDGARVRAHISPAGGAARRSDTTYAAPVFSSASLELLARALVSRPASATRLDLYYPFPAPFGARQAALSVTGAESASVRGGRVVECWVVAAELPSGVTRLWIDKTTGEVVQFASGEGGAVFWFRRPGAPAT
jgi:hypothetical protein